MFVIKDRIRERKYYKYSYDSWTRPNITNNNTMGFSDFACTASLNSTTAYQCFDGNISTYFNTGSNSSNPQNITFYSKNALNITQMTIYQYTAEQYYYSRNITIQGSENGEDWIDITTWERTSWVASFTIDMSSNINYYNYYRVVVTNRSYYDGNNAYWILGEIECVGTQRIKNISTEEDYDIYEDIEKEVIKTPNEIERKYYKYSYITWTQPIISANGTIGGDDFAVWATAERSSYPAWKAIIGGAWVSNTSTKPCIYEFYNKNPLKVTTITWKNNDDGNYNITGGNFQGSTDGNTWIDLGTFDNVGTANATRTLNVSSPSDYKYYRFYVTSATGNEVIISNLQITATEKIVTESTSSDYDFYEDINHTRVYKSF